MSSDRRVHRAGSVQLIAGSTTAEYSPAHQRPSTFSNRPVDERLAVHEIQLLDVERRVERIERLLRAADDEASERGSIWAGAWTR
jgi:hypothetical protein